MNAGLEPTHFLGCFRVKMHYVTFDPNSVDFLSQKWAQKKFSRGEPWRKTEAIEYASGNIYLPDKCVYAHMQNKHVVRLPIENEFTIVTSIYTITQHYKCMWHLYNFIIFPFLLVNKDTQ